MDRLVACIAIVAIVVVARMAYRANFNFFTFVLAMTVFIGCGLVVTGTLP